MVEANKLVECLREVRTKSKSLSFPELRPAKSLRGMWCSREESFNTAERPRMVTYESNLTRLFTGASLSTWSGQNFVRACTINPTSPPQSFPRAACQIRIYSLLPSPLLPAGNKIVQTPDRLWGSRSAKSAQELLCRAQAQTHPSLLYSNQCTKSVK